MSKFRQFAFASAILASVAAVPAVGQDSPAVQFEGDTFDVTGAGSLDLGDLDAVLKPYRRAFDRGNVRLGLTLTIDANGSITGCEGDAGERLAEAQLTLCNHAVAFGRFEQYPFLELNYAQATYELSVRSSIERPRAGEPEFIVSTGYPYRGSAVRFGEYAIPPLEERLSQVDLRMTPMTYPARALGYEIEAAVEVAITFDSEGRVATCRPFFSSNTARIAYDTCREATRSFRLINAPDERPYVWRTRWVLKY